MKKSRYIAVMGLMLALASALQFLESLISLPLPMGVKAGFSSIVVMYVLTEFGFASAMTIAVLKSCFVFVTRGASAFCMSVSGGILSVLAMGLVVLVSRKSKDGAGILTMSVSGGVFHNIGQLAAASAIAESLVTASYLPVLIISGIISGIVTGTLFRVLMPCIKK
ncbi:MAG: Gx transporter family protein [Oscillospiraceae bacterium]|nr:Gx transporter family protein [Oscillospiraceae bacterium]